MKTHAFTRFLQLLFPSSSKLAAITVIILAACCDCGFADVMVRITASPGTSKETVVTIHDGDALDADGATGGLSLVDYAVFDTVEQIFEFSSLDISSSPTHIPWDFDALLTNALSLVDAGEFRIEVTRTGLDATEYADGGLFLGDIGGSALFDGLALKYTAGFDANNQPFVMSAAIPTYEFNPTRGLEIESFAYSGSVAIPILGGPFSITARYDFTATAAYQNIGFDSLNEASLVVPEPASMAVLSGLSAVAVPCWQRLRDKRRKREAV